MFALIARLFGFSPASAPRAFEDSLAQSLMESAETRTGRDAHELRQAAAAYLSVVR